MHRGFVYHNSKFNKSRLMGELSRCSASQFTRNFVFSSTIFVFKMKIENILLYRDANLNYAIATAFHVKSSGIPC